MIPRPPSLNDFSHGTRLIAGAGETTILADLDFETYSAAGFVWNPEINKFDPLKGARQKGLEVVGMSVYTEHPEAEVLSLAYNLKDGKGARLWRPGDPLPLDLFLHINRGDLLEAWNVGFEYRVWTNICIQKYGFPKLRIEQLRCASAKSRAHGLPSSLANAGEVLNIKNQKDKEGKRLLTKFSIPRNPTKYDARKRILPIESVEDAELLYKYNLRDIEAESEISSLVPDLNEFELQFFLADQVINDRGVAIDIEMLEKCIEIVEAAHEKYNRELQQITNGAVSSASEIAKISKWLSQQNVIITSLDADSLDELLKRPFPPHIKRVLEIRSLISSAAVKKLFAMKNQVSKDGRLRDQFIYHSARTGRTAGRGVQLQNFPNGGIDVYECQSCKRFSNPIKPQAALTHACAWCGESGLHKLKEWNKEAVNDVFEAVKTSSLELVEYFFTDAIGAVSGCLRGLLVARDNHSVICSDYSAIEAVVLAALAGEEWRLEVFRTHGMIYEMSASKITGIDFEEYMLYKGSTGQHHPTRKTHGKVAELASGYGGWIGAWKQFGADEFFTDEEIKKAILAWRNASPAIVNFWGGQRWNGEYFGLEGAAIKAVLNPGTIIHVGKNGEFVEKKDNDSSISYFIKSDALYCQLPSGRFITYHRPRLRQSERRPGTLALSFEGWNTNVKMGAMGWVRMDTYGGKLCENVVQGVSRDILAHAILSLEKAKYPVILHVHDEIAAEIPENWGSISEFEEIMSKLPAWANGWPLKAKGGWRDKRYGK